MNSHEYIRSITEIVPDVQESSSESGGFLGMSLQTWIILILVLALLGINIFAYLAKGTQETVTVFNQIFGPILRLLGYGTLTATKQTVETAASGTKAGVDIVAGATTGAIDKIQQAIVPTGTSGTSVGISSVPEGQQADSSLPVQDKIQRGGANRIREEQDSLNRALYNAKQTGEVRPDDSRSLIQTTGKSGWCYIGEEQGIRTCSEIGANDVCMSGDVFPSQEICMNPNLRA